MLTVNCCYLSEQIIECGLIVLTRKEGTPKMPKKKTGQRKKAEKQKERQRLIRNTERPLVDRPCNFIMVGLNVIFYYRPPYVCLYDATGLLPILSPLTNYCHQ